MKYLPKLTMLYSYFSTREVDDGLLKAFFGQGGEANFVATQFNKEHKQVQEAKEMLEEIVDMALTEEQQLMEALILLKDSVASREDHIYYPLIHNIYFPKWRAEHLQRLQAIYHLLKYKYLYYFSYTNQDAAFVNSEYVEMLRLLYGNELKPGENALAKAIFERMNIKRLKVFNSRSTTDPIERKKACQDSLLFIQLIHDSTFNDDQCFKDFQIACHSVRPVAHEYILTEEKLDELTTKTDLEPEKHEWYDHIEKRVQNFRPIRETRDLNRLAVYVRKQAELKKQKILENPPPLKDIVIRKQKLIIFCSATPSDLRTLDTRGEFFSLLKMLADDLQASLAHKDYYILPIFHSKIEDFKRVMLNFKPEIVHFAGHGSRFDGLYFEDEHGEAKPIPIEALGDFFGLASQKPHCVVLNACYAETQAQSIKQQGVSYVLGYSEKIPDVQAKAFSRGFYTAYFTGRSIDEAVEIGRNGIETEYGNPDLLKLLK